MKPLTPSQIALALMAAAALIPGARADQVINDDLIVDGSACIGLDCVNGESFGFDTLRLKENNLRIKFDDTSTSASFPRNDWQLTANESSNGGAEKFSIDDITGGRTPFTIEASAPSHSLYVDDGGRLGLGTSTPVSDIHVKSGNTPTLRLEQDGTSGFTPQTWDVAGNEANFFVRDATSGSTLPLRIYPGAPSNALTIEGTTGDVGVGTTSPETELHIEQSAAEATQLWIENTNATAQNTGFRLINNAGTWLVQTNNASQLVWNLTGDADTEMSLTPAGDLTISGSLVAQGGDGVSDPGDTFPDYVFEPDYQLMPIAELEAFIKKNKHLPNVVSADEISKAKGINMTELQLQMLEKVEELTLYTLEQQKLIGQLREEIGALKEQVGKP